MMKLMRRWYCYATSSAEHHALGRPHRHGLSHVTDPLKSTKKTVMKIDKEFKLEVKTARQHASILFTNLHAVNSLHFFHYISLRSLISVNVVQTRHSCSLKLGGSLPGLEITYEEWGPHDGEVVVVMPALSAGSHLKSSVTDPTPGWWEGLLHSSRR